MVRTPVACDHDASAAEQEENLLVMMVMTAVNTDPAFRLQNMRGPCSPLRKPFRAAACCSCCHLHRTARVLHRVLVHRFHGKQNNLTGHCDNGGNKRLHEELSRFG